MADYNEMKEKLRRDGAAEQTMKFMEMANPTARLMTESAPPRPQPPVPGSKSRMVRGEGSVDAPGPTRARALFDVVKSAIGAGREFDPELEREILDTLDTFDTIRAGQADRGSRNMPGFAEYEREKNAYAAYDSRGKNAPITEDR